MVDSSCTIRMRGRCSARDSMGCSNMEISGAGLTDNGFEMRGPIWQRAVKNSKRQIERVSWICFINGYLEVFFGLPEIAIETNYTMLALAGFLVGYGTRLGSGCTSGHGVCGISRRSPRSIAATIVFMLAGFMTVYLLRHVFTFWLG